MSGKNRGTVDMGWRIFLPFTINPKILTSFITSNQYVWLMDGHYIVSNHSVWYVAYFSEWIYPALWVCISIVYIHVYTHTYYLMSVIYLLTEKRLSCGDRNVKDNAKCILLPKYIFLLETSKWQINFWKIPKNQKLPNSSQFLWKSFFEKVSKYPQKSHFNRASRIIILENV